MATIYNFGDEVAAIDSVADGDRFLMFDTSSQLTKYALGSDLKSYQGQSIVNTTATTLTITAALHAGKMVTIATAAACVVTLPQATGTGNRYRFTFTVAATATTSSITVANATDVMAGVVWMLTTSSDNAIGFKTTATDDTMKFNGTTLGGVIYDQYEVIDAKTGFFLVNGFSRPTGTYATPFLANV